MALPLSLPSGPRRIANYLPICGPHIKCLRDFAPGVVVVSIRAHPRQLLDILAIQIHFSTTYPFLIPPLPLVLILNPGIHMGGKNIHQRSPIPWGHSAKEDLCEEPTDGSFGGTGRGLKATNSR